MLADALFVHKKRISGRIRRERLLLWPVAFRQKFPDYPRHRPTREYFIIARVHNDNHILVRIDVNILAQHPVVHKTPRDIVHPDMITIFGIVFPAGLNLRRNRRLYPFL